jgi:hypothetical protein
LAQELERNEERFRNANERLKWRLVELAAVDRVPFVCECADGECLDVVDVTIAEYESVRARPRAYLLAPGHDVRLVGRVVERSERFVVVVAVT